ncbi:MFS transporter permease [Peribacillus asahii]|uniref:MFS transporter permease n=1 Tax=Peribacillus asahii TaxID=228899 RepID=UPI00207A415A|nr:MFS transporter permease [Peribacillus asahii]USK60728.1 MFS transporter permease [Peribacillus asahii]
MKNSNMIMMVTFLIAVGMIVKAFVLNEDVKVFLLIFFAVGTGLGLLRLFVNNSIKKMKGKGWKTKVLFFSVLLGLGLPFQSWFRNDVLLSMNPSYLTSSLIIMVVGLLFMTTFFSYITKKLNVKSVSE